MPTSTQGAEPAQNSPFASVQRIVQLMLENRSFDHMLGFLYPGKSGPGGQPFEGLPGTESNDDSRGKPVRVFPIDASSPSAYFMPGAKGYANTNVQLFGSGSPPTPPVATMTGFGVRSLPCWSPLIPAGTIDRVPDGSTPIDHTSVLKTIEQRWGLPALTARDVAATALGGVLTLPTPRTDDPLAGVAAPTARGQNPAAGEVSHLLSAHADQVSDLQVPLSRLHDAPLRDVRPPVLLYSGLPWRHAP